MSFSFLPLRILQLSAWRDRSKLKTIFVERPPSVAVKTDPAMPTDSIANGAQQPKRPAQRYNAVERARWERLNERFLESALIDGYSLGRICASLSSPSPHHSFVYCFVPQTLASMLQPLATPYFSLIGARKTTFEARAESEIAADVVDGGGESATFVAISAQSPRRGSLPSDRPRAMGPQSHFPLSLLVYHAFALLPFFYRQKCLAHPIPSLALLPHAPRRHRALGVQTGGVLISLHSPAH
ncbi:hypothetical protein B0H14DRAFT_3853552 [Mycena olivaceomarginata]|nr:hypothetical protein B0H14DRAFT_3853552 [Mycena olivaceomarginata]